MSDKKYLIANPGSASRKYALCSATGAVVKEIFKIHFEKDNGKSIATATIDGRAETIDLSAKNYAQSLEFTLDYLLKCGLLGALSEIAGISMRIVAPGRYFQENKLIDKKYLAMLKAAKERAPLHLMPVFDELAQIKKVLPNIKIAGISDSAFNADMPDTARLYGLSRDIAEKYDIYRFGYHGISAQSISPKIKAMVGSLPARVIICHLGSGSSIIAVKDGRCFDTSMGFTPLEGLPMGTRVGNIDAGAVIYMLKKARMTPDKLSSYFNSKCGLLGISGKTSDVRELLRFEKNGDKNAAQALESFVYAVKKYIGAYTAAMGGLDLLVFTATIGERSFVMRERICTGLGAIGILVDEEKNNSIVGSADGFIESAASKVKIAVIRTDETHVMTEETVKLV